MYTLEHATVILGKSNNTVRKWIKHYGMKITRMTIDRTRSYISDSDMLTLVEHFNRNRPEDPIREELLQKYNSTQAKKEANIADQYTEEDKPHSLVDAALFLGVDESTLRKWIAKQNIEKIRITTDKNRVYISHADLLMLSRQHRRDTTHTEHHTVVQDIKEIRSQLKDMAADIEDIKRDMRMYVKKSIYLG